MSCLTKAMIAKGATIHEVQAVLDADRVLAAGTNGDAALEEAEWIIDSAAEKYLGVHPYEGGER